MGLFDSIWNGIKFLGDLPTFGMYSTVMDSMTGETQKKIVEDTNNLNLQIARETNQLNYDMWKEQLAYNDPSSQMERLKSAGLNPQLVMGNMQNVATSSPQAQSATMATPPAPQYDLNQLLNFAFKKAELRKANAEADNAQYQADIQETQAFVAQQMYNKYSTDPKFLDDSLTSDTRRANADIDLVNSNIVNSILKYELTTQEIIKLQEEINNIRKIGNGISFENRVKRYRASLADANINPDTKGFSLILELLIKNPNLFSKLLSGMIKHSFDTSDVFQERLNQIFQK